MELKIRTETTTEVEIELPVYRKDNCHFYKVYSDEKCIQVSDTYFNPSISMCHAELAWSSKDNIDCAKAEFEEAFDRISILLSDLAK